MDQTNEMDRFNEITLANLAQYKSSAVTSLEYSSGEVNAFKTNTKIINLYEIATITKLPADDVHVLETFLEFNDKLIGDNLRFELLELIDLKKKLVNVVKEWKELYNARAKTITDIFNAKRGNI